MKDLKQIEKLLACETEFVTITSIEWDSRNIISWITAKTITRTLDTGERCYYYIQVINTRNCNELEVSFESYDINGNHPEEHMIVTLDDTPYCVQEFVKKVQEIL